MMVTRTFERMIFVCYMLQKPWQRYKYKIDKEVVKYGEGWVNFLKYMHRDEATVIVAAAAMRFYLESMTFEGEKVSEKILRKTFTPGMAVEFINDLVRAHTNDGLSGDVEFADIFLSQYPVLRKAVKSAK